MRRHSDLVVVHFVFVVTFRVTHFGGLQRGNSIEEGHGIKPAMPGGSNRDGRLTFSPGYLLCLIPVCWLRTLHLQIGPSLVSLGTLNQRFSCRRLGSCARRSLVLIQHSRIRSVNSSSSRKGLKSQMSTVIMECLHLLHSRIHKPHTGAISHRSYWFLLLHTILKSGI